MDITHGIYVSVCHYLVNDPPGKILTGQELEIGQGHLYAQAQ